MHRLDWSLCRLTKLVETHSHSLPAVFERGTNSLLRGFKISVEACCSMFGTTRFEANAGVWHELAYSMSKLPGFVRGFGATLLTLSHWLQTRFDRSAPAKTWFDCRRDTSEMLELVASLYADVLSSVRKDGLHHVHDALKICDKGIVIAIPDQVRSYLTLAIVATSARILGRTIVDERVVSTATFGPWTKELWKNLNVISAKPHQLLAAGQLHRTEHERVIVITDAQTAQTLRIASQRVIVSARSESFGQITFY
jgi:hypothetical protein